MSFLFRWRKREVIERIEKLAHEYLVKAESCDREATEVRKQAIEWFRRYKATGNKQYLLRAEEYLKYSKELEEKATVYHKLHIMMQRLKRDVELSESTEFLDKARDLVNTLVRINIDVEYKQIDRLLEKYGAKVTEIVETRTPVSEKEFEEAMRTVETVGGERDVVAELEELERMLEGETGRKRVVSEKEGSG